jgi:hypothetical protein
MVVMMVPSVVVTPLSRTRPDGAGLSGSGRTGAPAPVRRSHTRTIPWIDTANVAKIDILNVA